VRRVIAVDGPSGVGKSSVSKLLAQRLGWTYLDTGAMYRAVTYAWLHQGAPESALRDPCWLSGLELDFKGDAVSLGAEDISQSIRSAQVTARASLVSAEPTVRSFLTQMQREMGARRPCILDGRDIGTVVFPDAFFKVFLSADPAVRARRRWLELGGDACGRTLEQVRHELATRDQQDSSRDLAPLKKADDALLVNTDDVTLEQVTDFLYGEAQARLAAFVGETAAKPPL